uniref:GLI-3 n=1 Tax=Schmidtea mediterranea TaxID=79327 RepID=D2ILS5_SCHMD|nr:GLI-3 [Schmidtea mediterranea]
MASILLNSSTSNRSVDPDYFAKSSVSTSPPGKIPRQSLGHCFTGEQQKLKSSALANNLYVTQIKDGNKISPLSINSTYSNDSGIHLNRCKDALTNDFVHSYSGDYYSPQINIHQFSNCNLSNQIYTSIDSRPHPKLICFWIDCYQSFHDCKSLVNHIEKMHVDQRNIKDEYTCFWQGCSRKLKPFNARYKLLIHMRVHSGEKPNKCKYSGCDKAFSRLENLKIHERSHTGERPYQCQYIGCPKAFSNSSDRAKHQRTHYDTKPYCCGVAGCGKRYTDPSSLRKHTKSHQNFQSQLNASIDPNLWYSEKSPSMFDHKIVTDKQMLPPLKCGSIINGFPQRPTYVSGRRQNKLTKPADFPLLNIQNNITNKVNGCVNFHNQYHMDQNGHYPQLESFNVYNVIPENRNVFKQTSMQTSPINPACQYKQTISSNPYYLPQNQTSISIPFQNPQPVQIQNDKTYSCNYAIDNNQLYAVSLSGNSIMENGYDNQTSQISSWMQNL